MGYALLLLPSPPVGEGGERSSPGEGEDLAATKIASAITSGFNRLSLFQNRKMLKPRSDNSPSRRHDRCRYPHVDCRQPQQSNAARKKPSPRSMVPSALGDETASEQAGASAATAKSHFGISCPNTKRLGEAPHVTWYVLTHPPHPTAFGGHPLPRGEREERHHLFGLSRIILSSSPQRMWW